MNQEINTIAELISQQNTLPLAVHTAGTVTYVISGVYAIGSVSGYKITRITEPNDDQKFIDSGLLLESDRVSGANGSAGLVDLKNDAVNSLLLLTNPTIIYG